MGRAKPSGSRAPRVVAFAGPSLFGVAGRELERLDGVELRPPAERGDVLAAVAERPDALVLLDGIYFTVPTVTHKELLYALDCGVRVIGAASLGALRAAELEAFGMVGAGRVFEWFRDGVLDGDDEVAVLHAPAELGYRPLTVALVELRAAVAAAELEGWLGHEAGAALIAAVKALPFSERSAGRVAALARGLLPAGARDELLGRLERPGIKREDALVALQQAGAGGDEPASGAGSEPPERGPDTEFSVFFKESYLRPPRCRVRSPRATAGFEASPPTLLEAWQAVQALHPQAPALVEGLRRRFLLASEAVHAGLEASADDAAAPAFSPPLLPRRELLAEARIRALAEAAVAHHGDAGEAFSSLARRLGLARAPVRRAGSDLGSSGDDGRLVGLLAAQRGLVPAWSFARAFAASPHAPLVDAALAVAAAAGEVHRCYERWRGDRQTCRRALSEVAAGLWRCAPEEVVAEGARRDLFPASGFAPGLWEVLERLAPAERLARPINGYREAKSALLACELSGICPRPAWEATAQEAFSAR